MTKPTILKDPLEVYQGDYFLTRLVLVPQPGIQLIDWAQWRAWLVSEGNKKAEFTVDVSLLEENRVTLSLEASVTQSLGAENGDILDWDLEAVRDDKPKTWLRGRVRWSTDVTKVA